VPQRVHDMGNIDVIWTSDAASIAGGANPDGLGREDLLPVAVLDMTEDLIGQNVHGIGDGAPCRTLLALITGLELLAAGMNDFRQKRVLR